MILLDASVLLAAEDTEDAHHHDAVVLLTSGQPLATIDLALYEVINIAEARWQDPAAGQRLRARVFLIETYGQMVRVDRELADAAARLCRELDLGAYDAAYLAAARMLGAPLASCDERDLVGPGLARTPGELL